MIVETPRALVEAVEAELSGSSLRRQVDALGELHGLFTSARGGMRRLSYLDVPHLRGAYLRYYLPLNVARASRALTEILRVRPKVRDLLDIADLGAGPGTATIATILSPGTWPSGPACLLQDRSRAGLAVARRILERCLGHASPSSISTVTGTIPPFPRLPRRALVWLSMVLNEIEARSRVRLEPTSLLDALARALDPPSLLVIIEPALRGPGRSLLRLHDAALSTGAWRVVAPCTHQLRCPLLRAADRSWCHFRFEWRAPPSVREIAEPLGLDWRSPSLAFLALERTEVSAEAGDPSRARVIGDPMRVAGGGHGIYICREGERVLADANRGEAGRGDVIIAAPAGEVSVVAPWT